MNLNAVGHWRNGELIPVLDRLMDDLGATIFRIDPYGNANWLESEGLVTQQFEVSNDVLEAIFRSRDFQDSWNAARYLEGRGATLVLDVTGIVPSWMYESDRRTLSDVVGYAKMVTSMMEWARNEEQLNVTLFSPINETDLGPPEGPLADPGTLTKVLTAVVDQLASAGLDDVRLVAPDQAYISTDYIESMSEADSLRDHVFAAAVHCYQDNAGFADVQNLLRDRELPWEFWLTEFGDLDQSGEIEWEYAVRTTRRLLRGLRNGVQAATVWDAYDNIHRHDEAWTLWGLLRVASRGRYTAKRRYFTVRQVFRFVPAGSDCLAITDVDRDEVGSDDINLAAFRRPDGEIVLVGINEGTEDCNIEIVNDNLDKPVALVLTTPQLSCEEVAQFAGLSNTVITIPGNAVFTIVPAGIVGTAKGGVA